MARLNIEDCWWTDPRREKLGSLLGSMMLADAVIIRAWRIAQQFWSNERGLIPKHVFDTIEANANLIQANLAEERENGFYIKGSSQYLEWTAERRLAARAGGLKSAQNRSKKPKQTASKRKQTQPSYSYSSSFSSSDSYSDSEVKTLENQKAATVTPIAPVSNVNEVIAVYCDEWRVRYKSETSPTIGGKNAGLLKTLVKDLGSEKAKRYIVAYFQMPDSWFIKKRHDIITLLGSLNAITHYLESGKLITNREIAQLDSAMTNQNTLQALRDGKV